VCSGRESATSWFLLWHLIPSWAKDAKIAYSTINARADTVATKPAFRSAFKELLELCLAAEYVPSRETFIALSRVPKVERKRWGELAVARRWTADHLKEEIKQVYGIRSNGGQSPAAPRTVEQAERQFQRIVTRLEVLRTTLLQANQARTQHPPELRIRVPRRHLNPLLEPDNLIEAVQDALADATNIDQAA
jgi:hypothetical protein